MNVEELKNSFEKAGQGHVFKYFGELSDAEKSALLSQLEQVDLDELARLDKELVFAENKGGAVDFSKLEPAPYMPLPADKTADAECLFEIQQAYDQDLLRLDESARINDPSGGENNWCWRMRKEDVDEDLAHKLADLMKLYCRYNWIADEKKRELSSMKA